MSTTALATLFSMADPALKDVLQAIAKLDAKVDKLDAKVDKLDAKVDKLDAKVDRRVDELRGEMKKGFEELDKELTGHARVHAQIEKDLETLKRRPARTAARPTRPRAR